MDSIIHPPDKTGSSSREDALGSLRRWTPPRGIPTSHPLCGPPEAEESVLGPPSSPGSTRSKSLKALERHAFPTGTPAQAPLFADKGSCRVPPKRAVLKLPSPQKSSSALRELESHRTPRGSPAKNDLLSTAPYLPQRRFDEGSYIGKPSRRREINEVADILKDNAEWWNTDGVLHIYNYDGAPVWFPIKDKDTATTVFRKVLRDRDDITSGLCPDDYSTLWKTLRTHPDLTSRDTGELGDHENLLNCRDGVINVLSPSLQVLKHSPDFHFRSYVDVSCAEIQRCHREPEYLEAFHHGYFENFAARMSSGDPQKVQMLLESAAFVTIEHRFKGFYLLYGPHSTGKSQWGKYLKWLVGDRYTHALEGLHGFDDKYALGDLYGKKLGLGLEVPHEARISSRAVGAIKTLTGDDPINAKVKYGHSFTYDYGRPMLVFASNFPIYVDDEAFLDRMYVIPFDATPVPKAEQVPKLHEHLREETPYILYRSILAYQDYLRRRNGPTRVNLPHEWDQPAASSSEDHIYEFLKALTEVNIDSQLSTQQLYQEYLTYSENATISLVSFAKFLPGALRRAFPGMVEPQKAVAGSQSRGYKNLAFKSSV